MTAQHGQNSGMCIPCSVRQTADKGLGIFAEAAVSKGSNIWRHRPGLYQVLDEKSLTKLLQKGSREDAIDLLTHIISIEEFPGYMIRLHDEGALINHADQPNVIRAHRAIDYRGPAVNTTEEVARALSDDHFRLVAVRDLAKGDELLMDYNIEPDDPEYYEQACRRYEVTWDWL